MIDRDKLRKVEAILADRTATAGEKAAALRARQQMRRRHVEEERAKIQSGGLMYLLGRAWQRVRDTPEGRGPDQTLPYVLGRTFRKLFSRR